MRGCWADILISSSLVPFLYGTAQTPQVKQIFADTQFAQGAATAALLKAANNPFFLWLCKKLLQEESLSFRGLGFFRCKLK